MPVVAQSKVFFLEQDNDAIDGNDHIIKSTFNSNTCKIAVKASTQSETAHHEQIINKARDNMTKHNVKVIENHKKVLLSAAQKGVFYCSEEIDGCRCMCAFSTKGGLERHMKAKNHRYPTTDLSSWIHQLHLNGNFAFSLAVGTRTNRSKAVNKGTQFTVKECKTYPETHPDVDSNWFSDGCYTKQRKVPFRASESLKSDLENLFLEGFISDRPKKGENKYTGLTALIHLKNLRLSNARRKYSYDPKNKNGPLPTKEYIKAWFSRRTAK